MQCGERAGWCIYWGGGARGVASHLKEDKLKRFNNCESWQGGVCQKLNFAIRFFSELLLLVL